MALLSTGEIEPFIRCRFDGGQVPIPHAEIRSYPSHLNVACEGMLRLARSTARPWLGIGGVNAPFGQLEVFAVAGGRTMRSASMVRVNAGDEEITVCF